MNRRDFLKSMGAFVSLAGGSAAFGGCRMFTGARDDFDDNLTVFVSDVHVQPSGHQGAYFRKVVAEILRMDPLPRTVVCFGDIARSFGKAEDYETSLPIWRELTNAGIRLTLGMGNHDRRERFLPVWPEYERRTRVPGRIVTVTDLGSCDLILFDSLHEDHFDETQHTDGNGELTGDQWDWMRAELPKWKRPVFVGSHHAVADIKTGDAKAFNDLLMESPNVVGYLHGHNHQWKPGRLCPSKHKWGNRVWKRWLCLPSASHWGDIGYVTFRTGEGVARADLVMRDHFFPNPESRVWMDDEVVREKQGRFLTFRWGGSGDLWPVRNSEG